MPEDDEQFIKLLERALKAKQLSTDSRSTARQGWTEQFAKTKSCEDL